MCMYVCVCVCVCVCMCVCVCVSIYIYIYIYYVCIETAALKCSGRMQHGLGRKSEDPLWCLRRAFFKEETLDMARNTGSSVKNNDCVGTLDVCRAS